MLNVVMALALLSPATGGSPAVTGSVEWRPASAVVDRTPADIARTYDELRSKARAERLDQFEQLPDAVKSGVWAHHLLAARVQHPEFTREQREVIQQALLLLTPDLFAIDSSDPQWAERVDKPLRRLTDRAVAAFGAQMARELFAQLGPEPAADTQALALPPKVRPADLPYCTCNTWSDYCGLFYRCVTGGCYWKSWGCGTFFRYACVGLCVMYQGGGGG